MGFFPGPGATDLPVVSEAWTPELPQKMHLVLPSAPAGDDPLQPFKQVALGSNPAAPPNQLGWSGQVGPPP